MELSKKIVGNSYYNDTQLSTFRNVIHSTVLTLFPFWQSKLFPNDANRVLYSTPEFAFRRRVDTLENENIEN